MTDDAAEKEYPYAVRLIDTAAQHTEIWVTAYTFRTETDALAAIATALTVGTVGDAIPRLDGLRLDHRRYHTAIENGPVLLPYRYRVVVSYKRPPDYCLTHVWLVDTLSPKLGAEDLIDHELIRAGFPIWTAHKIATF